MEYTRPATWDDVATKDQMDATVISRALEELKKR